MEYFDEYLSPEIFLNFFVSSFFFKQLHKGVLYLSRKRKIFLFPVLDIEWH